jgi:PAS domain S-box-containing protein
LAAEVAARRSLMENLPDAIVEQGRTGVISLAAGRVQPILGRTAQDVVGLALEELLVAEEREDFRTMVQAVHGGGAPLADEFTVLTPDGRQVPCEVSLSATGEEGSSIVRAVFRDISTRRALEADVVRAREIATRREKLAAIGQLAAGVAHEINNPLSFVKSNLSTMTTHLDDLTERLSKVAPLLEPPQDGDLTGEEILSDMRDMAHESHTGIERIASIVQALKGMARSRGDDRAAFNPAKSIQDAALIFRGAKRGCTIEVELASALPAIKGSPGALGQVVLNLLDNALDAMDGQGTIDIKAKDVGERLQITVADHGSGIPQVARERMFEPFFTTKESGKGTGLGLYICYEIVKQMNGEISFETGDTGTTFTIEIPAAK